MDEAIALAHRHSTSHPQLCTVRAPIKEGGELILRVISFSKFLATLVAQEKKFSFSGVKLSTTSGSDILMNYACIN